MGTPKNWTAIAESDFPWEQDALDFVRQRFPAHEPYRAWSNFEFLADDGSINEVDLLVFTPQGLFLVEIKSRPGVLAGDSRTWTWRHDGRSIVADNPVFLANQKAKKLAAALGRQRAFAKRRVPFIEPLTFCSAEDLQSQLQGNARFHVCLRDQEQRPGIMAALTRRDCPGLSDQPRGAFDRPTAKALGRALEQLGIRPSRRSRRVGDYQLAEILDEGPGYQDFLGKHVALKDTFRRIRIYLVQAQSCPEERTTIQRAAEREFRLLQSLEHRGVLRAMEFTNHELGPAILFQHHPAAVRLDHYLVHVDWQRRVAYVEATDQKGRSRWKGQGRGLGYRLCQAIRRVLASDGDRECWSARACRQMAEVREDFAWLGSQGSVVTHGGSGEAEWWTFAGAGANATLANQLAQLTRTAVEHDSFSLTFPSSVTADSIEDAIGQLRSGDPAEMQPEVDEEAIVGLKFSECLPADMAIQMLQARLHDPDPVRRVLGEAVRFVVV